MLTRRSALLGTAAVASVAAPVAMAEHLYRASDPLLALRAQREHVRTTMGNLPDTPEGDDLGYELIDGMCEAELAIMRADAESLAGALVQLEQLCLWEREGVINGGEEAIVRQVEALPGRIARLSGRLS